VLGNASADFSFFPFMVQVMVRGFKVLVEKNHPSIAELYNKVSTLAAISWALYPVVFIFSEGTGDWSPNFEVLQ
jgi:bacteriorhodopsin